MPHLALKDRMVKRETDYDDDRFKGESPHERFEVLSQVVYCTRYSTLISKRMKRGEQRNVIFETATTNSRQRNSRDQTGIAMSSFRRYFQVWDSTGTVERS